VDLLPGRVVLRNHQYGKTFGPLLGPAEAEPVEPVPVDRRPVAALADHLDRDASADVENIKVVLKKLRDLSRELKGRLRPRTWSGRPGRNGHLDGDHALQFGVVSV
jgi:hypothetical protein